MKSPLLLLLLLLLPQKLVGFVHDKKSTIPAYITISKEPPSIVPSHHHHRHVFSGSRPSSGLTILSASESVSLINQLADPLLIQHMATGGILALAGDVIAQSLLSSSDDGKKSFPPANWDKVRTAAFVAFGAIYTGGAQHFIFGFLNEEFASPLTRLAIAQFGFIPFCYYPTFLLMVPTLRAGWESEFGSDVASIRQTELFRDVASKIPTTLVRNWCFWLPVQFVQFNFIPTDLQVTYAAAFGVIWNAILSWSTETASSKEA
mmetsp:Transcript_30008/g.33641  ORF Transcript_30008/g.33641 Transcript_30008/m.33641 type:complete len:262 (-) Transcript_30008:2498-3283(-)